MLARTQAMATSYPKGGCHFEQRWLCEKNPKKRKFSAMVAGDSDVCVFGDVADLGEKTAYCHQHKQEWPVEDVTCAIGGFSCKDVSIANNESDRSGLVLDKATSKGGTAESFNGFLSLTDVHDIDWAVLENTDGLLEGEVVANIDVLLAKCASRNYEVLPLVCDNTQHGLPWFRIRMFFLLIKVLSKMFRVRGYAEFFKTFVAKVETCKRRPPSLEDVLYPEDSPYVKKVLEGLKEKAPVELLASTAEKHMSFFRSHDLRWGAVHAPSSTEVPVATKSL